MIGYCSNLRMINTNIGFLYFSAMLPHLSEMHLQIDFFVRWQMVAVWQKKSFLAYYLYIRGKMSTFASRMKYVHS